MKSALGFLDKRSGRMEDWARNGTSLRTSVRPSMAVRTSLESFSVDTIFSKC